MKKFYLTLSLLLAMTFTACDDNDADAQPSNNGNNGQTSRVVKPNDIIKFGAYPQSSSSADAPLDSISWVVLKVDNGKALLLAASLLSYRPWDATGQHLTWDDCSLRHWLNNEFLHTAFSNDERKAIAPTALDNSDQNGYGTPAGKNTTDSVFLLSVDEFNTYVKGTPLATAAPTRLAISEGAYANSQGNAAWWLRSPGMAAFGPAYLSSAGELGTRAHRATEGIIGTRPALWITIPQR